MKTEKLFIRISYKMKEEMKKIADEKEMSISEYIRFLYIQDISRSEKKESEDE